MKLFTPQIANNFQYMEHADINKTLSYGQRINRRSLKTIWEAGSAYFINVPDRGAKKPKPNLNLFFGSLTFPIRIEKQIFPQKTEDIEFLPLNVDGEPWLVANCLRTTRGYDPFESVLWRSGDEGQISMVTYVVVNDSSLEHCEMFNLENSNGTSVLMQPSLVERVTALGLKGVTFKEIGVLNLDKDQFLEY